jgi:hypothetical protein
MCNSSHARLIGLVQKSEFLLIRYGFSHGQLLLLKNQMKNCFQLIVQGYCIERELSAAGNRQIGSFWSNQLV